MIGGPLTGLWRFLSCISCARDVGLCLVGSHCSCLISVVALLLVPGCGINLIGCLLGCARNVGVCSLIYQVASVSS